MATSRSAPDMVPLAAFGKPLAPPPRAGTNRRLLMVSLAVALVFLALFTWWIVASRPQERAFWSHTSALDQRTQSR